MPARALSGGRPAIDITFRGIEIGPIEIRFYALALMAGLLAAWWLARRELARLGEDPEHATNIMLLGVPLGLIGARLYHVVDSNNWPFFRANPEQIPAIWQGGLGIFGAVAGAILALAIYCRWKRLNILKFLDVGAPAFLLGQAIGRWGNFFNQELYGRPTDLPWGIPIAPENRLAPFQAFEHFHPLFLYESLLNLIGVAVLLYVYRRFGDRLKHGDILLMYFIWYPAVRFGLEFLRLDPWVQAGLPMAQWISGASIIIASAVLLWRRRDQVFPDAARPAALSKSARRREQRKARRS